ncbi:MAG: hypothetical protein HETSPECPRED_005723 [Heterodermia speciosa]|uniref:Heme haloperoxidase family profile domain-containing protein n=1 Tax=Heterodermia speciosa TaxID=116794 RepID=A0A8H3FJS6_9LECA|nr:MAG: hypothetical protein HETSPECPRED_005723 [Heterodermia speciosa]
MLLKVGLFLLSATLANCDPAGHHWQAPLSTDIRSPCPGVNALANHGFLPRNGLNISLDQFITGVTEGLNFETNFTIFAVAVYQPFTTTGYNNTLNLNDLDHHAIPGEHDGSLSRNDLFFGDNHSFNPSIWSTVFSHFHNTTTISIPTAARARKARFAAAQALNPDFTPNLNASLNETPLYLKAMQGQDNDTKTEYVRILFEEERIPYKEGWRRSVKPVTLADINQLMLEIEAAT